MASNPSTPFLPTTRREFLNLSAKGIGLLAFSRFAPSFLVRSTLAGTPAPEKDKRILVIVQLAGGNDGLNTLIPFQDDNYYRLRPTIGIARDSVLRLNDSIGLHPSCDGLRRLVDSGTLALVQNVGYPNPNRSHFRSTEIWETASDSSSFLGTGWIGRYLDNTCAGAPTAAAEDPLAVHVNTLNGTPETFIGESEHPTVGLMAYNATHKENEQSRAFLEHVASQGPMESNDSVSYLRHTLMDTLVTEKKVQSVIGDYKAGVAYPGNPFGASLKNVAALIASGMSTRVYFVTLNGFDTHVNQLATQANLLKQLSDGLAAFQKDLEAHKLDDQVVTMTFSEFGRRPSENESKGTDHGTAAPLFVMGSKVKAGLHGSAPSLSVAHNQDIAFSTDFRSVYATMLDQWLGCPADPVLGAKFDPLPLFAAQGARSA